MALRREEWSLRVGYVEKLVERGAIILHEFPGVSRVLVVAESSRAVGIACKKRGLRHPWTRKDRRIPVGSLLISGWRSIRNPQSLNFFDELERITGIPNRWLQMPGYKLLYCYLHVDNLNSLQRMQEHIIDEEGAYQDEQAKLRIAVNQLEELNLTLPDELASEDREILAQGLAYVEELFERCFAPEKANLRNFASDLRKKIDTIYERFQFEKGLREQIRAIRGRQDKITQISPFFAARKRAAEEEIKRYLRILNSALKMTAFYLQKAEERTISQKPETVSGALSATSQRIKEEILAQPARTPARQAAVRIKKAAGCWKDDIEARRKEVLSHLRAAHTFLVSASQRLTP